MNAQRIEELDRINNELFDKLVPASGKAETIGGEMLRAINRLIYRYYNDGDIVIQGYGIETCMSSYLFLEDNLSELGLIKLDWKRHWEDERIDPKQAAWNELAFNYSENDKYNDALYRLLELIVDFINTDGRAKQANCNDSRNWREDEVDDMVRQYEMDEEYEEDYYEEEYEED